MIKVCDAIMGSGKSSATIRMFNENPGKKYIYVSPYVDEAARIAKACPELDFQEPRDDLPMYKRSKTLHSLDLLERGKNIASTHVMFKNYSARFLELIKSQGYTLVIDEAVEVFEKALVKSRDVEELKALGYIAELGDNITANPVEHVLSRYDDVYNLAKTNRLVKTTEKGKLHYWALNKELFLAFEDVYVLTYLFDYQPLRYYFDMLDMKYSKIAIDHPSEDVYRFTDGHGYIPEYTKDLSKKIHIFENEKLNSIGDEKHSLSASYFNNKNKQREVKQLSRNVCNYFRHYLKDVPASKRMWSVYKSAKNKIAQNGYISSYTAYNQKATNELRHKTALAYCVNVHMDPSLVQVLGRYDIVPNIDNYALSVMIQWIWRSAIRDGEEIHIYIPSKRMRDMLKEWIVATENEYYKFAGGMPEETEGRAAA